MELGDEKRQKRNLPGGDHWVTQITDTELIAIDTLLKALTPFKMKDRKRIIGYVTERLGDIPVNETDRVLQHMLAFARANKQKKIVWIKEHRAFTGLGLRESKDYCDKLQEDYPELSRDDDDEEDRDE